MASEKMKAGPVATGTDLRNSGLATYSESNRALSDIQAEHLSVIFGLPADTAVTIAELVFAGCPR